MKEYWVKYDFVETKFGKRPNWIKCFKNKNEANEFAKTKADGVVVELTLIETI